VRKQSKFGSSVGKILRRQYACSSLAGILQITREAGSIEGRRKGETEGGSEVGCSSRDFALNDSELDMSALHVAVEGLSARTNSIAHAENAMGFTSYFVVRICA
jgi:hypothetical protein